MATTDDPRSVAVAADDRMHGTANRLPALPNGPSRVTTVSRSGSPADEGPSVLAAAARAPGLVLALAVLGGLLGLAWVALNWSSYHASARVVLSDPWDADIGTTDRPVGGDFERFVRSQARFVESDAVIDAAAETLDMSPSDLDDAVSASVNESGDVLTITASAASPDEAEDRLDAIIDAYSSQRQEAVQSQLDEALAGIDAELATPEGAFNDELRRRRSELRIAVAAYGDGVAFIERDEVTAELGTIEKLAIPLLGALGGLGVGLLAAWIVADRHPRVDDPEQLAERHGITFLGSVPAVGRVVPSDPASRSSFEVTMLALAHQLRSRPTRYGGRTYGVVITSGDADSGVTATARMLAQAAIDNGALAEVVDADVRRRPTGTIDIAADLTSKPDRDLLLYDCAPPNVDSTAIRLGMDADAVLLVVRRGCDARGVEEALRIFDSVGQRPDGVIETVELEGGRS